VYHVLILIKTLYFHTNSIIVTLLFSVVYVLFAVKDGYPQVYDIRLKLS
jgi:hypothetical protein